MEKHLTTCPLCQCNMIYKQHKDSHFWSCSGDTCPAILMEYIEPSDVDNLKEYVNRHLPE